MKTLKLLFTEFKKDDKLAHFFGVGWLYFVLIPYGFELAIPICMVVSFGKELWDSRNGGTGFNALDLIASLAGMIVSLLISLI